VLDLPDHFELDPAPAQAPEPGSTQGATIRVELQPGEEPARAAQRCLERYAELRRASEKLRELLEGSGARLRHLEQLAFELEQPLSAQEVAEAAHEAARFGITVVPARRASRAAASKTTATEGRSLPITLHSPGGFEVLVGRNNRQNEDLLRRGAPDDLWFHARGVPGAHVLLRRAGRPGEVPAEDTIFAAGLAAGHSRAAQATQAAVDCTELRLVRRGRGAVPGFVTYSGEKTLFVRPSGAEGEAGADRSD
jgi:predicted ribosome quality control (RQC) complex YloA/Tae2 family protein